MPGWIPTRQTLQEQINEEFAKMEAEQIREGVIPEPLPVSEPMQPIGGLEQAPPVTAPIMRAPTIVRPTEEVTLRPPKVPEVKEEPVSLPIWQRALQVFSAPFVWVDENIIKPSLALAGTTVGAVEEVERKAGEDFWEWKKRSWAEWKAPGFEFNVPWSNDPWRIDLKGVLELAPWLLIPGAGQVGTGARVARGFAGLAGKFGRVGKVLGRAIEYSPWGLVEKTAGVAIRGALKGISKVTGKITTKAGERVFGKIPEPPPPSPVVKEFTKWVDDIVRPAREAFEKEGLPKLRGRQYQAVEDVFASMRKGEITSIEATQLARKLQAGGEKWKYAVEAGKFGEDKVKELLDIAITASENAQIGQDSAWALWNLVSKGELPQPHHLKQWARAFGDDFAKAAGKFAKLPTSRKDKIIDILNLPRAVLASGDLSGTFRQGLILMLTHPTKAPRAFWRQLKHFASEKLSLEMDDALRSHSLYNNAIRDGVEFTAIRKGAEALAKEELFYSNLAQRIPFVRRSERAFTGFLNEMRMGAYEAAHNAMVAQGATRVQFRMLGQFINVASGRGTLPANLNKYAPLLNTVLFSPRYQMSTLQLPRQLGRMLLSGNPYMRKEAAKALITFVGGGSALLALLKTTGVAKVETDPRSGDFGKIVIGDTRLDIWRGYVQYARFLAQLLTGERKSAYGNMNKDERWNIAFRFVQSKASPGAGLFIDLLKGENYMGEPLFNETTGFIKMARDRLLPLAMQDVIDAMEQSGVNGLWTAAPAVLGVGVLTYVNDLVRVKEKIARTMGYKSWDDIDPKTQRAIQNKSVELQTAYMKFDRQVMGTAWGDWRNAGNAIEDVFREGIDLAVAQFRETGDGYTFREKVGDAFTARRGGYSARDAMPQFEDIVKRLNLEDTAESLIALGPEQLAIKVYNDALWGDDMYDEFGDYRFDEAEVRKQQLIQSLGQEMFDYVEDYRGLKYTDFPAEYHELAQARKVLKPYWQVKQQAIDIFGEPRTPWQVKRLNQFISTIRKRLKRSNPEIAKYIELFYVRKPF